MSNLSNTKKELAAGKTVITYTKGVSMQPLLYEGKTSVVIKPLSRPLKKGDLPLYILADNRYVLHRIIKIEGNMVYTRGDNCISCEKVPMERIIGIVTEIYRKGRTIKVTDRGYQCYVFFWNLIYPIRQFLCKTKLMIRKRMKR